MSHLSKNSISIFLHHLIITSNCFILMQTPLQSDIWLQSYEGFVNAKNNVKQRNLNTIFANISITTSPTSDSFLLIMSHMIISTRSHNLSLMHFNFIKTLYSMYNQWPNVWLLKHLTFSKFQNFKGYIRNYQTKPTPILVMFVLIWMHFSHWFQI